MTERLYVGYQMMRGAPDEEWIACRMFGSWDYEDSGDLFEIGEPVYLRFWESSSTQEPEEHRFEQGIWWIRGFNQQQCYTPFVVVSRRRTDGKLYEVEITKMRKLNAMERLAAEYAF